MSVLSKSVAIVARLSLEDSRLKESALKLWVGRIVLNQGSFAVVGQSKGL